MADDYYGRRAGPPAGAPWQPQDRGFRPGPPGPFGPGFERQPFPGSYPPRMDMGPGPTNTRMPLARISPPPKDTDRILDDPDKPNDCEIVLTCVSDEIEGFIEIVEDQLRRIGLKVDVMIPRESTKLTQLIDNLVKKGTFFAIVVKPENAAHKSLSVHVLRGSPKPTEHRNMPMDEAFNLIFNNYRELKHKELGVVPDPIKMLLEDVINDRSMNDRHYATLISFLMDRRKRQAAFDNRKPTESEFPAYTTEELQKKILEIICASANNGSKEGGSK